MDDVRILYGDRDITVCVKPPLISSQQDATGAVDMLSLLNGQIGKEHKCVHRLDFGVGGTMVYAVTQKAASRLSAAVADRSFEKVYLAVVYGCPAEKEGIYKDLLFKDSSKNKSYVVDRMRKGVKEASLEYKVIDTKNTEKGEMSLVWIKLHTGRTHQIRVQFASRKTPLYGDGKYGSKTNEKVTALWSYSLCFPHPVTGEKITLKSLPGTVFPWNTFNFEDLP